MLPTIQSSGSLGACSPCSEKEHSSYVKQTRTKKFQQMLSNIANDLDLLLTDLCQLYPFPGANSPMKSSFQPPQDTDNLTNNTREKNTLGNSKSSIGSESSSDQTLTSDSGHDEKTHDSFSPETTLYHIEDITQCHQTTSATSESTDPSLRPITLLERISKTHSIWLLPEIGRTGAVHLLKDRDTGTFIVRKSSQKHSLALSVQHRHADKSTVDHYLIENSEYGMTLQGSNHVFKSIPHLIVYYVLHQDELPSLLMLPVAILNAKTSQELSALSMLGQDFWLSKVSHCKMSDVSCGARLQKSSSEPINITVPSLDKQPPLDRVNSVTSQSLNDFSKFMKKRITTQRSLEGPELPPRTHTQIKLVQSDNAKVVSHKFDESDHRRHAMGLVNGDQQVPEPGEVVSRHTLKGYKEQVDLRSQTHPRVSERGKSSLHYTTSLDLLHIPEQSYFRSDLSDKMSDYEDIWKNNLSETESNNKNNVTCNISTQTTNSPGPFIPTVHNDIRHSVLSPLEEEHLPKCNIHKAIAMGTVTTQNDQKHALSEENFRTKQSEKYALAVETVRAHHDQSSASVTATSEHRVLQSQEYTSTMQINPQTASTSIPLSQNLNSAPKTKPPPLPRLSRIKSSSTSSLSTTASPVYAEPADAVDFKGSKGQAISVRIRRCSAPSAPVKLQEQWKQMDCQKSKPSECQIAKKTRLDTIFSPRMLQEHVEVSQHGDTVFSFEGRLRNRPPLAETFAHRKVVQRSQSLKVAVERKTKLSRQKSWRERFSKLKLDGAQNAVGGDGNRLKTIEDLNAQELCKLDDALFSLEDLEKNGDDIQSPTLSKFPVYKKKLPTDTGNRASCFSESSTVQDMISCALPDLTIRPMIPQTLANVKRVSEYDNLLNLYAPPSAASSVGTVFCKPWDNQPWAKLLPAGDTELQKDMSANDRVKLWQTANTDPHDGQSLAASDTDVEAVRTSSIIDESDGAPVFHNITNHNVESAHDLSEHHSRDNTQSCQLNHKSAEQTDSFRSVGGSRFYNVRSSDSTTGFNCLDDRLNDDTQNHQFLDEEAVFSDDNSLILNAELKDRMRPIVSHSSTLPHSSNSPGAKIKDYICRLSQDRSTTFGSTIENFIQCTLDSQETNPHTVMRNVRQFMTGIKNYLVKHGEGQLEDLIERERKNLGASEILNIDALIEGALHVCVIRPVKHHIYRLFVEDHNKNGNLQLMVRNIKYARSKTPQDIGIKEDVVPPHGSDLELIKHCLDKMQRAYSPLKKLENLLAATAIIYRCGQNKHQGLNRGPASLGADDFLPMLIYVLVHCGIVSAEIEADYMWGLLHPTLLTGEGGYYLTTLSSAVLVLKHFQETQQTKLSQHKGRLPSVSDMQGFLKIAIPDEVRDSIIWKTLPVRPNMTTKDVCKIIAHKFKITTSQDYSLFLLVNGEETQLADGLCPQMIKGEYIASGADVVFAYKRMAANIAWPTNMSQSSDR
ncbi:uncharacterized protein LOC121370362 [Gigantopelta aegis]|uniref:uncharacterized protein LOC121370362 n=1 Tax=Gigantopelta aegis TaxID=1735272 RepID=UPI001B887D83|nr:uncharacterized protein LOC121370362 [Gigantopelta aegis]